ncbi:MAG: hypothetical protein DCC65_11380 [Planctomycetota bacterium]|nr:MAG: hypothetical protein DCC65_11380 [Planctomycetota bacterium]
MRLNLAKILAAGSLVVALGCGAANAGSISFGLTTEFSGATTPSGSPPYLRATFTDVFGGVEIKLESLLNSSSEFVNVWYFNLDPVLDPNQLSFSYVSGSPNSASISTGVNAFQADGDGLYDIEFDWPNGGGGRFNNADVVTYLITSTQIISAASFNHLSAPAGGHGPYVSAAHVQGIGDGGSGWITTPEPSTSFLLAAGMIVIAARSRRRA